MMLSRELLALLLCGWITHALSIHRRGLLLLECILTKRLRKVASLLLLLLLLHGRLLVVRINIINTRNRRTKVAHLAQSLRTGIE